MIQVELLRERGICDAGGGEFGNAMGGYYKDTSVAKELPVLK